MGRKRYYQELYVFMNGLRVGTLIQHASGKLAFCYVDEWLNAENSRPISLSMPLTEVPYTDAVVDYFFDNLLPDNAQIRERIQTRFGAASKKCFDLLSHIGSDCVGALQLLTEPKVTQFRKIQATPLEDPAIARLLKQYHTAPLGMDRSLDFRISIAGAQEKTALLWHENKWWLPQGATPTTHIIKLPIGVIQHSNLDLSHSVENEWLCLKILSAFGLAVNTAEIKQFEDVKTLVVERFDRVWADTGRYLFRLPQEDLCQALGKSSAQKYESDGGPGIQEVMKILRGSEEATSDRKKFMKTVFLFWMLGAVDGHAKNFSLSIRPKGRYALTPLYDVISAYPLAAKRQLEWKNLKMAMSLKSKNRHYLWSTIQPRHWLGMANLCQFPAVEMQSIIEEAYDTLEKVIENVTEILPNNFPHFISDPIFSGMRKLKGQKHLQID